MALISVTGGTSTQRSLAQEVAYWALDQLVSRRMQNSLDIRIEIKPFVNEGNKFLDTQTPTASTNKP